jgi:hypothetical protein
VCLQIKRVKKGVNLDKVADPEMKDMTLAEHLSIFFNWSRDTTRFNWYFRDINIFLLSEKV